MTVEHLDWGAITFNRPVVHGRCGDKRNSGGVDPRPEDNFLGHLVGFHLGLHLDVEDLKCGAG